MLRLGVCAALLAVLVPVAAWGQAGRPSSARTAAEPGRFYPAAQPSAQLPAGSLAALDSAARQYAKDFDVSVRKARAVLHEQARGAGLEDALRDGLGDGFGQLSFDRRAGRWRILLSPSGSEDRARRILRERGIADAEIGSSPWSARELDSAVGELAARLDAHVRDGAVRFGERGDEGIVIQMSAALSGADRRSVRKIAAATGVSPEVQVVSTLPQVRAACGAHFCDPPVVAGVRYWNSHHGCSIGFAVTNGSPTRYNLTAGHCIHNPNWPNPGAADYTCNAAGTWCPQIGVDIGGYYGGGDAGVLQNTNAAFPNYPGIRIFGWAYPTYAIYGKENAAVGTYLCHTGYSSQTTCGTVTSTQATYTISGTAFSGMIAISGACLIPGDSGGPLFNGANLHAVGIAAAYSLPGSCPNSATYYEPVTRALPSLGLLDVVHQ